MSGKQQIIRSATGKVIDSRTVTILDESSDLKPDDVVIVIHADDYQRTFEMMMKRISEMDEKVNDQTKILDKNVAQKNKGFIGRFRKPKD